MLSDLYIPWLYWINNLGANGNYLKWHSKKATVLRKISMEMENH